jgi:hypothetical protein
MPKFIVLKKDATAFGSSDEGSFKVTDGFVELPLGALAADLLAEGVIKPAPEEVEPAQDEPEKPEPKPDPVTVLPVRKPRAKK